jgi:glycosyltransferase involved in cell wall biosynthesis
MSNKTMSPSISVIIPTFNRPDYLPRAVDSALVGMPPGEVEVIVVPNGPDKSWRQSLFPYQNNPSVRVIPIKEANANIARNKGFAEARGEFVRFLDDDDYLIPEGAKKQYALIRSSGADLVSGSVNLINEKGKVFNVWHQPAFDDFCVAALGPWRNCLPTAHLYKRSKLARLKWDINIQVRQDVDWFFELCSSQEWHWKKTKDIVGVWQHHWNKRISSSKKRNEIEKETVPMLIKAFKSLEKSGRLSKDRNRAISLGLWGFIQSAFYLEPSYWTKVSKLAKNIDPEAKPIKPVYQLPAFSRIDPLLIQWMILPKQWAFHQVRQILKKCNFHTLPQSGLIFYQLKKKLIKS